MKKISKSFGIYLAIFALIMGMLYFYNMGSKEEINEVPYSRITDYFAEKQVKAVEFDEMKITATLNSGKKVMAYAQSVLDIERLHKNYIEKDIDTSNAVVVKNKPPKEEPWFMPLLSTGAMILIFVFFWIFIMRQQGGGKAMSFGKSRARLQKGEDLKDLSFKDVAGLEEEKNELEEIVDFLKHPRRYRALGARIPKGILLVGPPGTGKTYISKATAGEAGVPFFTISGSDFVEMFVGVGASRVRDLFTEAKKNSPCIIFIDEIDAVGRKRGAGMGGGHDEREQTLNQLLVEMDGFATNSGIIILAATNRPDILDPALLRPGRFDRQIVIGIPDIKGREAIFKVHSKDKPLSEEVEPKVLARRTPGFTPADIENMLNEAALITARRKGRLIRMDEIEEAITKVIAGPEKKSRVRSKKENWLTAVHEAGHAIVARVLPDMDPVHQITIMPRGSAGGFTMTLPTEDKFYNTKKEMENEIVDLLGGRVAEMLVLDDVSTGASNDIMRATEIAKDMVMKYGFSKKLGPVNYSHTEEIFLGKDFSAKQNYSETTAAEIDKEIKIIVHNGFEKAKSILNEYMEQLLNVANVLIDLETIDGSQFETIFTGKMTPEELARDVREQETHRTHREMEEAAQVDAESGEVLSRASVDNEGILEEHSENIEPEED